MTERLWVRGRAEERGGQLPQRWWLGQFSFGWLAGSSWWFAEMNLWIHT